MAIRMSGLASGLDTESIIKELMAAQRTKLTKVENQQTTLTWKQDKWRDLNIKLLSFKEKEMTALRAQGSYRTKKVSSSNDAKASATAGIGATTGSHQLEIKELANSQNLTSGVIKNAAGETVKSDTGLLSGLGIAIGSEITVTGADGAAKVLKVTDKTTIRDFVKTCTDAGLKASFDTNQGRLYISSKESGATQKFTITSASGGYLGSEGRMKDLSGYNSDTTTAAEKTEIEEDIAKIAAAGAQKVGDIFDAIESGTAINPDDQDLADAIVRMKTKTDAAATAATEKSEKAVIRGEIKEAVYNDKTLVEMAADPATSGLVPGTPAYDAAFAEKLAQVKENVPDADIELEVDARYAADSVAIAARIQAKVVDAKTAAQTDLQSSAVTRAGGAQSILGKLGMNEVDGSAVTATDESEMSVTKATDAEFLLDGAYMTNSKNTFTANGLTIQLKEKTAAGESINFTVDNDTDQVYNMIKDFVKKYNEITKELNDSYYAESSKGYDPLTDEEKDALTDTEVEKWEGKIKDALLRRDSTVGSLTTSLRMAMMTTVEVEIDGEKKSISMAGTLGIRTAAYDYTEKGLLHIYGDQDDDKYAGEDNDLKAMLESNPEAVMELMTKVGDTLYKDWDKKMARIENVSSNRTFYNDVTMKKTQTTYKKKLSEMERKLTEMENRYYKQFTAMEKALAQLQGQTGALSSMMGMGGQ